MTEVVIGKRLYDWDGPGKAGVVTDTHFIRCFWPRLTEPTRIFAPGSSGLIVQGPPTPRNVVFPDDTVFPDIVTDAEGVAWEAFLGAGAGRGYVAAKPEQVAAYMQTYDSERKKLPPTAAKIRCRDDCCFLVHDEEIGRTGNGKPILERYVAEVSKQEAHDLCDGKVSRDELHTRKDFCRITDNPMKPSTSLYRVEGGAIRDKSGRTR